MLEPIQTIETYDKPEPRLVPPMVQTPGFGDIERSRHENSYPHFANLSKIKNGNTD
jgi:hypothetical protein